MATGTAVLQAARAPFPGLRSFSQDESELFFGRESQSDELARKLGQARFVAVVGTSGSGKSSLVRAGLLPSLEAGCLVKVGSNWRIVDMRPGGRPIDNLGAALSNAHLTATPADASGLHTSSLALSDLVRQAYQEKRLATDENLLILVDQFEELFRFKSVESSMDDRDEQAGFVKLLLEVAKQRKLPVYVVITMRSDFLGDCARFRDLPEAINAGQYLTPRMTREQRREAIEGPIHMAGSTITPRLVQRILNDVGEDPDQLPVMQHALMRTWYHWHNQHDAYRPVDIENYEGVGTLENALSSHADKAFMEASLHARRGDQIVARIFQRLRERDSSGRETRRPTTLRELCAVSEAPEEDVLLVLECFRREGRSFLMPPMTVSLQSEREVDITHESLLRNWKRLQGPPTDDSGWLAEEEESRRTMVRIADRAEQQVAGNPDYIRGPLLQLAVDWWNKRKPTEAWAERYTPGYADAEAYLRESERNQQLEMEREEEREREAQLALVEKARREHELEARQLKARRFRFISIAALAGLVLMSALAVFAWMQREKAEKQNRVAMSAERAAIAARTAAQALSRLDDQPDLALLLAAEASRDGETADTQSGLLEVLQTVPNLRMILEDHAKPVAGLVFRGDMLTSVDVGGTVLKHTDQGAASGQLDTKQRMDSDGKLSPKGHFFFSIGSSSLWDTSTGKEQRRFKSLSATAPIAFSGDERAMAGFSKKNVLLVWDLVRNKDAGRRLTLHKTPTAIALSHDARMLAIASPDFTVTLWDLRNVGKPVQVKRWSATDAVDFLEFDPSSKLLASGNRKSSLISFWDLASPKLTRHTVLQNGGVSSLAFSGDGKLLASGSRSGYVGVWKVGKPGQMQMELQHAHSFDVSSVAFNADGKMLASGGGTQIALWTVEQQNFSQVLPDSSPSAGYVDNIHFTQEGYLVASGSKTLPPVVPERKGGRGGAEIRVRAWHPASREAPQTSFWKEPGWNQATLSPDGRMFALQKFSKDGPNSNPCPKSEYRLVLANGQPVPGLRVDGTVTSAAFSPDSQGLVTATCGVSKSARYKIIPWDLTKPGNRPGPLPATAMVTSVALSPDRQTVAAASGADLTLWDIASRKRRLSASVTSPISILRFSPNGEKLAASSIDGATILWDARNGKELGRFTNHGALFDVAFSGDGKTVAFGTYSGAVLWNVETVQQIGALPNPHPYFPVFLAFNPNHKDMLALAAGGTVALWNINPATWKDLSCSLAHRNLSFAEWQQYRGGPYEKTCRNLPAHPSLVQAGRDLARQGESEEALSLFRRARVLDPSLKIDPEREVAKEVSVGRLQEAIRSTNTNPLKSLDAFREADRLNPSLEIPAESWNDVCWFGSLEGVAAKVMFACEKSIEMDPDNLGYKDSRGVGRALTGDTQGAITDFQAFLGGEYPEKYKGERRNWIKAMQAGRNPFSPEVLEGLENE